jgi:hypothetical protein
MFRRKLFVMLVLAFAVVVAACSASPRGGEAVMTESAKMAMEEGSPSQTEAEPEKTTEAMAQKSSDMTMEQTPEVMKTEMSADAGQPMANSPAFLAVPLVDVTSGLQFAIQDLKGKVLLVENLAMWCSKCFQQQNEVKALHELLGVRDDFVSLGLDIDPNENADDLKEFVAQNGFAWQYAVSPAEVSREIGQLYGEQFLNPTATPMFIIDRHGQVHPLPFGIKRAADLQAALQPFLDEEM